MRLNVRHHPSALAKGGSHTHEITGEVCGVKWQTANTWEACAQIRQDMRSSLLAPLKRCSVYTYYMYR